MSERRVQIVEVYGENINELFRGGLTVIEGLPDDAELVKTWDEPAREVYCFMFESEEFPIVDNGESAPVADITVAQRRVNTKTHWVCPNCTEVTESGDVVYDGSAETKAPF
jgi:hypothetical protein